MGSTATGLANNQSDVDICILMKEIDEKSTTDEVKAKESVVSAELVSLDTDTKVAQTEDNEKGKTDLDLIASVDDSEACNKSTASVGTTSNGKSDSSIPMLAKIEEVLKSYSK